MVYIWNSNLFSCSIPTTPIYHLLEQNPLIGKKEIKLDKSLDYSKISSITDVELKKEFNNVSNRLYDTFIRN